MVLLQLPAFMDGWVFQLVVLKRGYVEFRALRERFIELLRGLGRSPATVRAYVAAVDRYAGYTGSHLPTQADLVRYLRHRRDHVRQGTVNLELSALKAWNRWLAIAMPDSWAPVEIPRQRRPPPRVVMALSEVEVGMLLAAPDLGTYVGFRDHVIMATLYQCGLRASELSGLQLGSILPDGYLLVLGKGGHERLVPVGDAWMGLLDAYLRQRAALRPGKLNALFLTRHGRPLRDGRAVWVIVNRYARRTLGLACGYTRLDKFARGHPWQGHYPHLLRTTFATHLHRNGCDIMAISQLLGHAQAETTAQYIGVDLATLREAAEKLPRNRGRQPQEL